MIVWSIFIVFVVFALIIDLGVFNRNAHVIETKEAAIWTSIWVFSALAFSGLVYYSFEHGWIENPTQLSPGSAVLTFITSYLVELSLSVDNIFVIALIFSSYAIPRKFQHEVLFYGVLGAIIFRGLMIGFGVALVTQFHWIMYVFGVFLIFTALKMLFGKHEEPNPKDSRVFKWINKVYPVTYEVESDHFFIKKEGVKYATPLFVALVIIELTDILFAIDSIPAILAITTDPFIVFSSNILAIMGLRSMFFLIVGLLSKFRYINYSLVVILGFVGVKMLISHFVDLPDWFSLSIIVLSLAGGMIASSVIPVKKQE